MTTPNDATVIVVGGSLVGLSAALFLSHWDVSVILLERHPDSSPHPRAVGYTARTIELLRSVGLDKQLPEPIGQWQGPPRRIVVESLAGTWHRQQDWSQKPGAKPPGGQPANGTRPSGTRYSPVDGLATAQDRIEPVLRARAMELGADLRLGYTVNDWAQDEHGVAVSATTPSGETLTLRAAYLIACDGSRSPIREKLGISRRGVGHLRSLQSILFRCPPIDHFLERGYAQFQIQDREDGFEAFMTTYGQGRWALMWSEDDHGDSSDSNKAQDAAPLDEPSLKSRIRQAIGLPSLSLSDISLLASGRWSLAGLIADTFSSGRVYLAGDAAHALPPNRGGYGANTGIADAHNLAWKIAAVTRRSSGDAVSAEALLRTYDAERRPVALIRHDQVFAREDYRKFVEGREWEGKDVEIIDDVAMEFGQVYVSEGIVDEVNASGVLPPAKRPDEWRGQPGTRAPHIPLRKRGSESKISSIDLFGKDWVVVSPEESWRGLVESAINDTGVETRFVHIGAEVEEISPGEFATAYGLDESGAVLVRPDGFIAWRTVAKSNDSAILLSKALGMAAFAVKAAK